MYHSVRFAFALIYECTIPFQGVIPTLSRCVRFLAVCTWPLDHDIVCAEFSHATKEKFPFVQWTMCLADILLQPDKSVADKL